MPPYTNRADRPRVHDARVIDQHVEPPELLADALGRRVGGGLIGDVELEDSRIALDARRGLPPMLEVARSDEHGEAVRRQILGDLKTDSLLAPVTKASGLSWITNLPLIELAGSGLDLCGGCTLVRLGVPLTFTSVSQK